MLPPGTPVGASDPLNARERRRWQRDYLRIQAALIAAHRPELVGWLPGSFAVVARQRAHGALRGVEREMADLERLNARGPAQLLWRL